MVTGKGPLGVVEFESAHAMVDFGFDRNDNVRKRTSPNEGRTCCLHSSSFSAGQELVLWNVDMLGISIVDEKDRGVARCRLSSRVGRCSFALGNNTSAGFGNPPVGCVSNGDSLDILAPRTLEHAVRDFALTTMWSMSAA